MTQMMVACSLFIGIVGLLLVVAMTIFHDNRREHNKKVRTFDRCCPTRGIVNTAPFADKGATGGRP